MLLFRVSRAEPSLRKKAFFCPLALSCLQYNTAKGRFGRLTGDFLKCSQRSLVKFKKRLVDFKNIVFFVLNKITDDFIEHEGA